MPKYLVRDTGDGSLTTVEGPLPLDLNVVLSPGSYGVSALSEETLVAITSDGPINILMLGQSEPARLFGSSSFYRQITQPVLHPDANLVVQTNEVSSGDPNSNIQELVITGAATDNPALIEIANMGAVLFPNRRINLIDATVEGTGLSGLVDDVEAQRFWTIFEEVVTTARANYGEIHLVNMHWWVSDIVWQKTFRETFFPALMGEYLDGTLAPIGDPVTVGNNYLLDHILWDATVPLASKGRGIFARADTKYINSPMGPRIAAPGDPEAARYSTVAALIDRPARDELIAFQNDSRVPSDTTGISPHLCQFGDLDPGNVDGVSDTNHPSVQEPEGLALFAKHLAMSFMKGLGADVFEPDIIEIVPQPDGSYADVIVSLPNGGTLTTMRKLSGEPAPDPAPPQYQPVVGFEIAQGNALTPFGFTADIQDSGSGDPRTGSVRITPTTPFADGHEIDYLRGGATASLLFPRDWLARLYKDMLVEHVPAWAFGTHPYPGIPVRPQPDVTVVTGTSTPEDPFATKAAASDAHLTGPALPAGTTAVTWQIDAVFEAGTSIVELIHYISQTFRARLDARSGKGGVDLTVEDDTGSKVFLVASVESAISFGARTNFVVSMTQGDASNPAEHKIFIDGAEVGTGTAPAGSGVFATAIPLELLNYTGAETKLYSVRIWTEYTSDGDTAALGTPIHEIAGAASEWNTPNDTGSPGGLVKAGTGDFT